MKILLSTRKQNPQSINQLALQMGFDGIELVMLSRHQEEQHPDWTINDLEHVHAIHAPVAAYNHTGFASALNDAVSLADIFKSSVVNIHPPSAHEEYGGQDNLLDGLKLIASVQQKWPSIKICCEVLPRPTTEKHILQQAHDNPMKWQADIKAYGLHATLDTTHLSSWGEEPSSFIRLLGPRLTHLHLSDYLEVTEEQHVFPGEGNIRWANFFKTLKSESTKPAYVVIEPGNRFDLSKRKEQGRLLASLNFIRDHLKR